MLSTRTRSLSRIAAALVAVVALLVAPVRPMLECTMPAGDVESAAIDEHAGHAMPESVPADSAPAHGMCPDLAHCAIVAPLSVGATVEAQSIVRVALETFVATRPSSATASLEPPPPK